MKKQFLALFCVFAINCIAIADEQTKDIKTRLNAMNDERERVYKLKGSSELYFLENCPKHLSFWQQTAEQGEEIAQFLLAGCYYNGTGIDKNEVKATYWFRKSAEQGYAPAQNDLGIMYANGTGVAKDETQAVEWYSEAAEQGYVLAQNNLGVMYAKGNGVAKNKAQAAEWYQKAAEQGYALAQNNLGAMYQNDNNNTQAITWYQKAAEQGYAQSQDNLAFMYLNGKGVTKNVVQAVAWYHKAAEQGFAQSQYNLGAIYYNGTGVIKDDIQAEKWFRKAAEQGHVDAQNALNILENKEVANQSPAQNNTKISIDEANKQINIVWNATTKEIRKALLPEQREWLKKRKADCKAEPNPEDCMVNMTLERTEELKQKIAAISGEKDKVNFPVATNQNETTNTEVQNISNEKTNAEFENNSKVSFVSYLFEVIITIVILPFLFWLYKIKKRKAEVIKRERDKKELINLINRIIDETTNEHIKALSLEFNKLTRKDAYGNIIYEKWFKEIDHFIKHVLCKKEIVRQYIDYSSSNVLVEIKEKINKAVYEYNKNNKKQDDIDVADLSPNDFEYYCANILNQNGWETRVTQASGDQGIDVIATYGNIKAVFQCKKYSNPVGNKAVQEIVAGKQFERANIAAVVSNINYTASAKQLAQSTGTYLLHYSELADFHEKIGL